MPRSCFLIVSVLAAASIFPFLGVADVYQVSEGREGVVVNSILEHGDYVLPLRHAELVPSKPPLFHWLSAAVAKGRGVYDNAELRFVSAMGALLLATVLAYAAMRLVSGRVALLSGAVLVSTYGFLRMGSDGRVDMLLCFLFSAAVLRWFAAYQPRRAAGEPVESVPSAAYLQVAILAGLAFLAKGPLGFVLPVLVIGSYLLCTEGWRSLKVLVRKSWLVTFAIALPWYLAASVKGGAAVFSRQLMFENIERFLGGEGITQKPFWFYLEAFWAHALPWSIVGALVLVGAVWRRFKAGEIKVVHWLPAEGARRDVAKFSVIWCVSLLTLYSLSSGKRSAYLLTILPPYSLLLGLWLDSKWESFNDWFSALGETPPSTTRVYRAGLWTALALFVCGIFIAAMTLPAITSRLPGSEKFQVMMMSLGEAASADAKILSFSFAIVLFSGIFFWVRGFASGSPRLLACAVFCALQCALVVLMTAGQAARGLTHGYREFAAVTARTVPPGERITFIKRKRDESFDGYFFYLGRTVYLFEPGKNLEDPASLPQEPGWYLARKGWIDQQPDRWTTRVEPVETGGRRVDTPERKLVLFRLRPAVSDT